MFHTDVMDRMEAFYKDVSFLFILVPNPLQGRSTGKFARML